MTTRFVELLADALSEEAGCTVTVDADADERVAHTPKRIAIVDMKPSRHNPSREIFFSIVLPSFNCRWNRD
jgi:hypothetical protein